MINLLPDSQKKIIRSEYRNRLLISFLTLFFSTCVISIIFLVPSYVISQVKYNSLENQAGVISQKQNTKEDKDAENTVKDLTYKLSLLKFNNKNIDVRDLIGAIVSEKDPGVKFMNISYEKRGATSKIDISGTADNRDSLIKTIDRLKKDSLFSDVYSPVSNLLKDKDLAFNIQISVKP